MELGQSLVAKGRESDIDLLIVGTGTLNSTAGDSFERGFDRGGTRPQDVAYLLAQMLTKRTPFILARAEFSARKACPALHCFVFSSLSIRPVLFRLNFP